MKDTLTKENFWDEMSEKYPKAMEHFLKWIDQYKSENNWKKLFNGNIEYYSDGTPGIYGSEIYHKTQSPKYHELPIAMQFGIFLEYCYAVSEEFDYFLNNTSNDNSLHEEATITINNILNYIQEKLT